MRKTGITGTLLAFFQIAAFSQEKRGEVDSSFLSPLKMHYQNEYAFDKPVNKQEWTNVKGGLNVSFASTERSYFRTEVPLKQESQTWNTTGWKGEKLDAQIIVWSPDTLEQ